MKAKPHSRKKPENTGQPGHPGIEPDLVVKGPQQNFQKINVESPPPNLASQSSMKATKREIFDEQYRVIAVESQSLTIQGVSSGKVLTIINQTPEIPLSPSDYPPGKLIALSDPSRSAPN
jgi:hypothetical protein